jgi:hypothetical protein
MTPNRQFNKSASIMRPARLYAIGNEMGAKHPLLLIPDAIALGAYALFADHYVQFATGCYVTVGFLVGLKSLFKKD